MMFNPGRRLWLPGVVVLLLAACGFKLAGGGQLPAELARIHLQAQGFDAGQLASVKQRLSRAGAQLVELPEPTAGELRLRLEKRGDARLVSGAGSRSVRRLERRLSYSLRRPGSDEVTSGELVQRREISVDDDNLLSSDAEREATIADLEQALYNLLVSHLSRL